MHAICDFNAFFYISKICFEFGRNGNYSQVIVVVFSSFREKSEKEEEGSRPHDWAHNIVWFLLNCSSCLLLTYF